MKNILKILVFGCLLFYGCTKEDEKKVVIANDNSCLQEAVDDGKVFYSGDKKMLWGGENPDWHFDITGWSLRECQLRFGFGREVFDALIDPQYRTVEDEADRYMPSDHFIIVLTDDRAKVFSVPLLSQHEVINEVIDGTPVMVVFCSLANLLAVYNRRYCDTTLAFALSGYTYSNPDIWDGRDGFVLWDRETESLWWPLIDKAVSGQMNGTAMKMYSQDKWWEITWAEIIEDFPDALVLETGQTMDTPVDWPRYEEVLCK